MMNKSKYDLVIIGGGTSGVSCAWNAARHGLKTLIIEQNTYLGGSMTASLVTPAMKSSPNQINTDFFINLYNKLRELNGAITYIDGNMGWFNPELTKITLDILMSEVNVDIIYEANVTKIETQSNKILSLYIETIHNNKSSFETAVLSSPIETTYIVDATGDAKICEKLNCEFLNKKENSDEIQPTNLRFVMSGIDTKKFANWLVDFDKNRDVTTCGCIDSNIYLSTACTWDTSIKWALRPLFERAVEEKVLNIEDTNYFQIFSVAGTSNSIAFNAPRLINMLNNYSKAYTEGRLAILRLSNFCKKYLPGFENAYISSIAHTLGIRVSNRVKGKYVYTYQDLISGKKFKKPVLVSNYPIDIHSDKKNSSVLKRVEQEYQLPIEALMVDKYENLFVIGRCISADFRAQAALRIIPSCFSMGEGLAKYLLEKK